MRYISSKPCRIGLSSFLRKKLTSKSATGGQLCRPAQGERSGQRSVLISDSHHVTSTSKIHLTHQTGRTLPQRHPLFEGDRSAISMIVCSLMNWSVGLIIFSIQQGNTKSLALNSEAFEETKPLLKRLQDSNHCPESPDDEFLNCWRSKWPIPVKPSKRYP
ncbi:hypothetical protein PoB_001694900 [Plakobranchus ocellatus]|uniref:Uncharacterized protein n=1 Tax=Plakobranchus ocellatus TaxID=259542 RepID=A0AAV3Z959_9GAST|nr:hypothetical protein PoB_001694900 [Plakobranchus ocellatus]